MSYGTSGLRLLQQGIGSAPSLWTYTSTDVHTDVDADGYFADAVSRGMKVGDFVLVAKSTATIGATLHVVQSIASGAATISPAILS